MATRPWTYDDIPDEYRLNGGVWEPADAEAGSGNQIASAPDRWGLRHMVQATSAQQIYKGERAGFPAFVWPDTQGNRRMQVAQSFAPAWWVFVLAYNDTERSTFLNAPTIVGFDGSNRVVGQPNNNYLVQTQSTTWAQTLRRNAGEYLSAVLPMPMCLAEIRGTPVFGRWALGGTVTANAWQGPMWFAMALGTEPTGDLLARIQGYLAWRFGLQTRLPANHAYRAAAPTVEMPTVKGGAMASAGRAGGATRLRNPGRSVAIGSGVTAGGVCGLRMSAMGGAISGAIRAGGAGSGKSLRPRRYATAQDSASSVGGADGIRTTAGNDGLRITRVI